MTPEAPYSYRYSCSTTSDNSAGVPTRTAYRRLPTAYSTSTSTAYRLPPTALPPASCLILPPTCSYLPPASVTPHIQGPMMSSASPFCKGFLSFFLPAYCLLPTPDCPRPTAYCLLPASSALPIAYILPIHCLAILPTSTAYCIYCLPITAYTAYVYSTVYCGTA